MRNARGRGVIDERRHDLRDALRSLRRNPGAAIVAGVTLALAIASATGVFAVVYGLLFRPLPIDDEERVVAIFRTNPREIVPRGPVSGPRFSAYRAGTDLFHGMAAATTVSLDVSLHDAIERLNAELVSENFFEVLGVSAIVGRTFGIDDRVTGDIPCVISEDLWRATFSGDTSVVGRTLVGPDASCTITGVASDAFGRWRESRDIWIPYRLTPRLLNPATLDNDGFVVLHLLARLRDAVSLEQATTAIQAIDANVDLSLTGAADSAQGAMVVPVRDMTIGSGMRLSLSLLSVITILVLGLASANVTGLLMARNAVRRRELALRRALGATTRRLFRQLAAESAMLVVLGGTAGVLLATWFLPAILALAPNRFSHAAIMAVDVPALFFAVLIAVALIILISVLPALLPIRSDTSAFSGQGGKTEPPAAFRTHSILVGIQAALALPVVIAAATLAVHFASLQSIDPGFEPERLIQTRIGLPPVADSAEKALSFHERLTRQVSALPGVDAAAITTRSVQYLGRSDQEGVSVTIEGGRRFTNGNPETAPYAPGLTRATPEYFHAFGLRVLAGRTFTERDRAGVTPVAVVNETMARMHWPSANPIGKRVNFESVIPGRALKEPWTEIVGVVSDARQHRFESQPRPEIYVPLAQKPLAGTAILMVRGSLAVDQFAPVVRRAVHAVDSTAPVLGTRTMTNIIREATAEYRYSTTLIAFLALMALALSSAGVYSLCAFAAAQRRQDVAVRIVLGATRNGVLRLSLVRALRPAMVGLAVGCAVTLIALSVTSHSVSVIPVWNPIYALGATVFLIIVLAAASAIPAYRAAKVDPLAGLRAD